MQWETFERMAHIVRVKNGSALQKKHFRMEGVMAAKLLRWCRKDEVKQAVLILLMLLTVFLGRIH